MEIIRIEYTNVKLNVINGSIAITYEEAAGAPL